MSYERNKKLLQSLGLDKPFFEPKEKPRKKSNITVTEKKRKLDDTEASPAPIIKNARVEPDSGATGSASPQGVRRSSRNTGKIVDYKKEQKVDSPQPVSFKGGVSTTENEGPLGRQGGTRIHNPSAVDLIRTCQDR